MEIRMTEHQKQTFIKEQIVMYVRENHPQYKIDDQGDNIIFEGKEPASNLVYDSIRCVVVPWSLGKQVDSIALAQIQSKVADIESNVYNWE